MSRTVSFSSSVQEPSLQEMPVMPSPSMAGVLGMALTTRTFPPRRSVILEIVTPGARDITTCSGVTTSLISENTASKYWGFTASIRYFTAFAHSLLEPAWGTFVLAVTASILS